MTGKERTDTSTTMDWPQLSKEERCQHESLFYSQGPVDGVLSGERIRDLFLHSGLPLAVLSRLWNLADMTNDNLLDVNEFCLLMYLTLRHLRGRKLPVELPEILHPSPTPTIQLPVISDQEKALYLDEFHSHIDSDDQHITAEGAKKMLRGAGVSLGVLGRLFNLADLDKDGLLSATEWVVLCHLVKFIQQGNSLEGSVNVYSCVPDQISPHSLQAQKHRVSCYHRDKAKLSAWKERRKVECLREIKRHEIQLNKVKLIEQLYDILKATCPENIDEETFINKLQQEKEKLGKQEKIVIRLRREHERVRQETVKAILDEQRLEEDQRNLKLETEEIAKRLTTPHRKSTKDPDPFHQLHEERKELRKKGVRFINPDIPKIHIPFIFNPFDRDRLEKERRETESDRVFTDCDKEDKDDEDLLKASHDFWSKVFSFSPVESQTSLHATPTSSQATPPSSPATPVKMTSRTWTFTDLDTIKEEDAIFKTTPVSVKEEFWFSRYMSLDDSTDQHLIDLHRKVLDLKSEVEKLNQHGGQLVFKNPEDYKAKVIPKESGGRSDRARYYREKLLENGDRRHTSPAGNTQPKEESPTKKAAREYRLKRRSLNLEQQKVLGESVAGSTIKGGSAENIISSPRSSPRASPRTTRILSWRVGRPPSIGDSSTIQRTTPQKINFSEKAVAKSKSDYHQKTYHLNSPTLLDLPVSSSPDSLLVPGGDLFQIHNPHTEDISESETSSGISVLCDYSSGLSQPISPVSYASSIEPDKTDSFDEHPVFLDEAIPEIEPSFSELDVSDSDLGYSTLKESLDLKKEKENLETKDQITVTPVEINLPEVKPKDLIQTTDNVNISGEQRCDSDIDSGNNSGSETPPPLPVSAPPPCLESLPTQSQINTSIPNVPETSDTPQQNLPFPPITQPPLSETPPSLPRTPQPLSENSPFSQITQILQSETTLSPETSPRPETHPSSETKPLFKSEPNSSPLSEAPLIPPKTQPLSSETPPSKIPLSPPKSLPPSSETHLCPPRTQPPSETTPPQPKTKPPSSETLSSLLKTESLQPENILPSQPPPTESTLCSPLVDGEYNAQQNESECDVFVECDSPGHCDTPSQWATQSVKLEDTNTKLISPTNLSVSCDLPGVNTLSDQPLAVQGDAQRETEIHCEPTLKFEVKSDECFSDTFKESKRFDLDEKSAEQTKSVVNNCDTSTAAHRGEIKVTGDTSTAKHRGEIKVTGDTSTAAHRGEIKVTGDTSTAKHRGEIKVTGDTSAAAHRGEIKVTGDTSTAAHRGEIKATGDTSTAAHRGEIIVTGDTSAAAHRGEIKATGDTSTAAHRGEIIVTGDTSTATHRGEIKATGDTSTAAHRGEIKVTGDTSTAAHRGKIIVTGDTSTAAHRGEIKVTGDTSTAAHRGEIKATADDNTVDNLIQLDSTKECDSIEGCSSETPNPEIVPVDNKNISPNTEREPSSNLQPKFLKSEVERALPVNMSATIGFSSEGDDVMFAEHRTRQYKLPDDFIDVETTIEKDPKMIPIWDFPCKTERPPNQIIQQTGFVRNKDTIVQEEVIVVKNVNSAESQPKVEDLLLNLENKVQSESGEKREDSFSEDSDLSDEEDNSNSFRSFQLNETDTSLILPETGDDTSDAIVLVSYESQPSQDTVFETQISNSPLHVTKIITEDIQAVQAEESYAEPVSPEQIKRQESLEKAREFAEKVTPKYVVKKQGSGERQELSSEDLQELLQERRAVISQTTVPKKNTEWRDWVHDMSKNTGEVEAESIDKDATVYEWENKIAEETTLSPSARKASLDGDQFSGKINLYSENIITEDNTTAEVDREPIADIASTKRHWENIFLEKNSQKKEEVKPKGTVRHWEVKIHKYEKQSTNVENNNMADAEINENESAIEREIRLALEREELLKREKAALAHNGHSNNNNNNELIITAENSAPVRAAYEEMTEVDRAAEMLRRRVMGDLEPLEAEVDSEEMVIEDRRNSNASSQGSGSDDRGGVFLNESIVEREIRESTEREEERRRERANFRSTSRSSVSDRPDFTITTSADDMTDGVDRIRGRISPEMTYETAVSKPEHVGESLIARELRETREREEELRKMRQHVYANNATSPTPTSPTPISPPTPLSDKNVTKVTANNVQAEKNGHISVNDQARTSSWQKDVSPYKNGHQRKSSVDSLSSSQSSTRGSDTMSNRDKVKVQPLLSASTEENITSYVPCSETPIEREIRLAREREDDFRRAKGLPVVERKSESPKAIETTTTTNAVRPVNLPSDNNSTLKRLTNNRLKQEIKKEMAREETLRKEGKISTTSDQRAGQPMKFVEVKDETDGTPKRNFLIKKREVLSSKVDKSDQNGSVTPSTPVTPSSNTPKRNSLGGSATFSYKETRQKAESRIERELREMREREAELKEQRANATTTPVSSGQVESST